MSAGPKLRALPPRAPFHVVLVEPEIPPNTGAIARTCAATRSPLHLVGKLGFRIDAQAVRRAGLDYWDSVELYRHETWEAFRDKHPGLRLHLFSSAAPRSYLEVNFQPGDALVFGRESTGLDPALMATLPDRLCAIPTLGAVRSLNLSNAVAIALYESLRQSGCLQATFMEPSSRKDP